MVATLQEVEILLKLICYKNVTRKVMNMKKITRYYKRLRVSYIKTALFVIVINIFLLPQLTKFEKDGDNLFHLYLNGDDIGYVGKETDMDQLMINSRLQIAKQSDDLVYADADLKKEGSEVFFAKIDDEKVIEKRMVNALSKGIRKTLKHAYTVKIKEYTVNLSSSEEVKQVLQAALNQYEDNQQYKAELIMDPSRELNALTAQVVNNAEEKKEETPAFLQAGMEAYFNDIFQKIEPVSQTKDFDDFKYGLMSLNFGDNVEIVDSYLIADQITPLSQAIKEVTTVQDKNAIYKVQSGDTLSQIAETTNVPVDKIIALNDSIDNELATIRAGEDIIITQPEPPLSVERTEQMYYEEDYDADIIYVDNNDWYTTQEVTLQEPSAGHRNVAALVSFRNEKEVNREIVKQEVTMEAVPKIVEKGTKIPPTYVKPISGGRLSSGFGGRKAPKRGASTYHQGIDWSTPKGTTVVASCGGTVTKAGWGSGYGYVVYIKHPDGRETRYGHLSKVLVSAGQTVSQGQKIALSGNTGVSTGPHLHFEIRINGTAVNPLKYLN